MRYKKKKYKTIISCPFIRGKLKKLKKRYFATSLYFISLLNTTCVQKVIHSARVITEGNRSLGIISYY